jgi:hypothetical protein
MFHLSHELLATWIALGVEVSLFVLIPIYLHARWRREIRDRIRILYDSRRPEDFGAANVLAFSRIRPRHTGHSVRRRVA